MAVCLYREGDSHLIGGIPCEIGLFDIVEVSYQLERGWHESVDGIYSDDNMSAEEYEIALGVDAAHGEDNEFDAVAVSTIHPVRLKAKEAGIEGWEKRRIKKLEAELNGTTEG